MSKNQARVCRCEGWWEQDAFGRQPMENLRISFDAERIEGTGFDIVGPFMLTGMFSADGAVVMRKQYVGKHRVQYTGTFDGEGLMSGQWRIGLSEGLWMIRIRSVESDGIAEIREIVP